MSEYSPGIVQNSETLSRFAFNPMHFNDKGKMLPSIISHLENKGCSVQREDIATDNELKKFVTDFLTSGPNREWLGVIQFNCHFLRSLDIFNDGRPNICVYDTSEEHNPAHAEFARSNHIEDADKLELRRRILANVTLISPSNYRSGSIL